MGAWQCPTCGHGRFITERNMIYCKRPGCTFAEHSVSAAKSVITDRRGEWTTPALRPKPRRRAGRASR